MNTKKPTQINEFLFFGIESDIKNIIKTLIYRRKEKGYSQRDLANITGIKQSAIARMERLILYPRIDTLIKISRALDLTITFKRITTGWSHFELDTNQNNN